jgi:hypothetical protein
VVEGREKLGRGLGVGGWGRGLWGCIISKVAREVTVTEGRQPAVALHWLLFLVYFAACLFPLLMTLSGF